MHYNLLSFLIKFILIYLLRDEVTDTLSVYIVDSELPANEVPSLINASINYFVEFMVICRVWAFFYSEIIEILCSKFLIGVYFGSKSHSYTKGVELSQLK